jgi:hypothetical protein
VIANNIAMILIHIIGDLVKLHGRLLRVNFRLPRQINHNHALVGGVNYRCNCAVVVGSAKKLRNILESGNLIKFQNICGNFATHLTQQPAIHEKALRSDEHKTISHCDEHLKAEHAIDLLCNLTKLIVCSTKVDELAVETIADLRGKIE